MGSYIFAGVYLTEGITTGGTGGSWAKAGAATLGGSWAKAGAVTL